MACSTRTEALALALILSTSALAAPSAETRARTAAQEAKKAFDLGQYEQAIAGYEEAYRLKPAPGLLFNLGQSHRRAGHLDKATFYFRRYLETNPAPEQARATEEVLAQVEAQRVADEERKRAEAEQHRRDQESISHAQQLELENAKLQRAQAEQEAAKLALEQSLKAKPAPPPPLVQRPWFWVAIGTAVVGTATAITAVALAPQPTVTTFDDINAR